MFEKYIRLNVCPGQEGILRGPEEHGPKLFYFSNFKIICIYIKKINVFEIFKLYVMYELIRYLSFIQT